MTKIAIPIMVLGAICSLVVSPKQVGEQLLAYRFSLLILAVVGCLLGLSIQWLKWHGLLMAVRPHTRPLESWRSLLIGFAFGIMSPGRLGEVGRGALFAGHRTEAVALATFDRACSALISVLLALIGLAFLQPFVVLVGSGVFVSLIAIMWLVWSSIRIPGHWRSAGVIQRVTGALRSVSRSRLARTLVWSVVFNVVFCLQFYILCHNWIEPPPEALAAIPVIFGLKVLAPIGFLDLGPREAVAVLVFSNIGIAPAVALSSSLLLWFLNVLVPAVVGAVWMWFGGFSQGATKQVGCDADGAADGVFPISEMDDSLGEIELTHGVASLVVLTRGR